MRARAPARRRHQRRAARIPVQLRDWAAQKADAPREVCELALVQVNSDRVTAAYRLTDLFERHRSAPA